MSKILPDLNDFLVEVTQSVPNRVSRERRAKVIKEAESSGREVVFGQSDVLQIDVDSGDKLVLAEELLGWASAMLNVDRVVRTRSKSGNWHLYVFLVDPLERRERLLLQGLLGGDPRRAILDWQWAREGNSEECFLIESAGREGRREEEIEIKQNSNSDGYVG